MSSDRLGGHGNQGSAKRPRSNHDARAADEYLPGNIVEIEVHNFMTYSHLKSKPGARLNLVVGPNGSGKSSLVCAIGLGLAGEPPLLGRASSIGDYVKRGEESGMVKITLQDHSPDRFLSITRHINKQDKSEWTITENNVPRPASKKDVQEVVSRFNIQVNNLTQFLPQDRVTEFARMTPVQLLEETEKAVGDPELWSQHSSLIKSHAEVEKIGTTLKQAKSLLANLKASTAHTERDVQLVQERKNLFEKAENLKKKLHVVQLEQQRALFEAAKEKEREAQQQVNAAVEKANALKRPLEVLKRKKSEFETVIMRLQQAQDRLNKQRQACQESESKWGEQVRAKTTRIAEVRTSEREKQERLEKASRELAEAEAEFANLPVSKPPQQEIEDIAGQIRELQLRMAERRNLKQEKEQILIHTRQQREQVVRRIAEIVGAKNRLLQALRNTGAHGIIEAYRWVESHRHEFQKDVYGPVLLEINISNREHAKYVENHVPKYIWQAFVTQDEEDRDYLQRNLNKFGVAIINARDPSVRNFAPPLTCQMKEMGIVARLDEVVSAPSVVMHVLNGQALLDRSFIGTSQANACADQAYAMGVKDLWTPENHYRWSGSLYGTHITTNVTSVRPSHLFSQSVDARLKNKFEDQKTELEREILQTEQEVQKLEDDVRALEEEALPLNKHREELLKEVKIERRKRTDGASRIEQRKRILELLHMEEDSRTGEERLLAEIANLNQLRKKNVLKLTDLVKRFRDNHIKLIFEKLASTETEVKVRKLENEIRREDKLVLEVKNSFTICASETSRLQDLLSRARRLAEPNVNDELQDMFREMPDSIDDLEDAIGDITAEADSVPFVNPGVVKDYERLRKQIDNLEDEIDSSGSRLQVCLSEIESIKAKWLPTLRSLVAEINESFGQNFREIAVAGEVLLDEHGMNFGKYGILIKVKFRKTGMLQVLSAHHQSGGERSVSTILYLVSLQDLTRCPFRVVDEINQGMDPQNERKMFQQLVKAASQLKTPQCFLLTPKLLVNLEYNEACTILNVMNGPYIDDAAKRWKDGPSWGTLTQSLA